MKIPLPKPLVDAQKKGIEYFMGEYCEWKLQIEESPKFIEDTVGSPVCVFANNGFGDYLFLKKKPDNRGYDEKAFEFFHETPEESVRHSSVTSQ
ncbi:MAG: hypothetical protein Q3M24_04135 [Candidatus Electrothrix aestuarii]|uniref:Uncharacterized protein n=1 Tax=Candidatus Electrothrix aestuarii TaxID=3062594 RepID=A0AAU8LXL9_9BACT|nr:hypothetical protein [Candidatus Electrothrix aestuarii]